MKTYNGERAIISLTSWKARIATAGVTIFSLLKSCPGFHIVLVLSIDEFPRQMNEMPESIRLLANTDKIEILWVQKNYKSMKKVIFTMQKYPSVPIISADDDCIYTENYALNLYNTWRYHQDTIFRYSARKGYEQAPQGPCTIYPPNNKSHYYERMMDYLQVGMTAGDDDAGKLVIRNYGMGIGCLNKGIPFIFHTTIGAMHPIQSKVKFYKGCF